MCGGSCNKTCCVVLPTPFNSNSRGMKMYTGYIWGMFALMFLTYFGCIPNALAFGVGGAVMPVPIVGLIFAIIETPSCKTMRQISKVDPKYAITVSRFSIINWVLFFVSFVPGIAASCLLYAYDDYYGECFGEIKYYLEQDYNDVYSLVNNRDDFHSYSYGHSDDCEYIVPGFWCAIATSVAGFLQMILMVFYLNLQYHVPKFGTKNDELTYESDINDLDADVGGRSNDYPRGNTMDGRNYTNNEEQIKQLMMAVQGLSAQVQHIQGNQGQQNVQQPQLGVIY